jgi:hypothetical protein
MKERTQTMKNNIYRNLRKFCLAAGIVLAVGSGSHATAAGRIVAANDDWIFSETGFGCGDPGRFAQNICAWFTEGKPGKFLVYSTHFGLIGPSLSNAVASVGHTWIVDPAASITLTNLFEFDGIFLGYGSGGPNPMMVDWNIMKAYVQAGGSIYVFCGDPGMVDVYNPFLRDFGFAFEAVSDGTGCDPISDPHPIFSGVTALFKMNGTPVHVLESSDPRSQSLAGGLFGVWDPDVQPPLSIFPAVEICWPSTSNRTYQIQWRSSLSPTNWANLGEPIMGTGSNISVFDTTRGSQQRFYRLQNPAR